MDQIQLVPKELSDSGIEKKCGSYDYLIKVDNGH